MKYTRYDIKRKKSKNHYGTIVVSAILILAVLIVLVISPFIFKNKDQTTIVDIQKNQNQVSKNLEVASFIMIQCGAFQKRDNATKLQLELAKTLGDCYIIQDLDSNRVIFGIYTESEGTNILKSLSDKKVENSKMTFLVKENDLCNKEIVELINANLQVINTLSNKSIKSIQTEELKKWTSALKETDKKSLNYNELGDLKAHTLNISKELSKSNIQESYTYLYNILKKIK